MPKRLSRSTTTLFTSWIAAAAMTGLALVLRRSGPEDAALLGVTAVAFASNARRELSHGWRLAALLVQGLQTGRLLLQVTAALLSWDGGRWGWETVPWWFWGFVAVLFAVCVAAMLGGWRRLLDLGTA
jgi:hypothetical protein